MPWRGFAFAVSKFLANEWPGRNDARWSKGYRVQSMTSTACPFVTEALNDVTRLSARWQYSGGSTVPEVVN
jgi:hypothetical protein